MECIEHSIGESGGGKSPLDAGFGTDKYEVRAEVLKNCGESDVITPGTLVQCLNKRVDIKGNAISYLVNLQRNTISPRELPSDVGGLWSASYRQLTYDNENCQIFTYYCFGKKDESVIDIAENACECNHVHPLICNKCQIMNIFLNKFQNIIEKFQINIVNKNETDVDSAFKSNSEKFYK